MRRDKLSILITGATGSIGPQVVQALNTAGHHIRVLVRQTPILNIVNSIDVYKGDITDSDTVKVAVQGVDVVIHLAALLHIVNPPPTLYPEYERVNIKGTANLVQAALHHGVKRIVYASTVNVYGESNGQILTEEVQPNPGTVYAQTKLAGEQLILNEKNKDGEPLGVVLRLGAVYGPQIKGNYQQLLQLLAANRFFPIGKGENRRTLVYDKDVAQAILLALQHPQAVGQVFNVSDGKYHTVHDIITAMCAALGRNAPRYAIPVAPIRFTAGLLEDLGQTIGYRAPIVRATIDKYTEDIAVSSRRIQERLQFKPQYDLYTGWRETVEELRRSGEL